MKARWLLLPVIAIALVGCSKNEATGSVVTEEKYLLEMHAAGNYNDEQSRSIAHSMCLADSVDKAEAALYMAATDYPDLAVFTGLAAGWGVRAYCPDKADLWLEAGNNLAEEIR